MKTLKDLLREADPLQHEQMPIPDQCELSREKVLRAVPTPGPPTKRSRSGMAMFAGLTSILIIASALFFRLWPPLVSELYAAVSFEIRLAEEKPGHGLRKAKLSDSGQVIYLHNDAIVTNTDIESARVIQGGGPSQYGVEVRFNSAGISKMRTATVNHIGKRLAILIDGQVILAPVIRSAIDASARITGQFTKAQADRIANGVRIQ